MDVKGLPFVLKGRVVNANSKNIRAQFEANTVEDYRKLTEMFMPTVAGGKSLEKKEK